MCTCLELTFLLFTSSIFWGGGLFREGVQKQPENNGGPKIYSTHESPKKQTVLTPNMPPTETHSSHMFVYLVVLKDLFTCLGQTE